MTVFAASAAAAPGDVLASFPTPASAPTGLAYDGGRLWVTDRLSDSLYAVDPETGDVTARLPAPGFIPRGLAWDGGALWVVDGEEGRISRVDVASGLTVHAIDAPVRTPDGLAWDGEYLWLADRSSDALLKISTADGTTVERYDAPAGNPTGLAYWNNYLLVSDRREDRIYLFDPAHGEVVFGFDSPGKYPRGLAVNGDKLYNADYQDDRIHRIELAEAGQSWARDDGKTLAVTLTHEFRNYGPGEVPSLDVYIAVPHSLPNQELTRELSFDPEPDGFVEDRWGQKFAHYELADLAPAERNRVRMHAHAKLYSVQWFVYPDRVGGLDEIPARIRDSYLVNEDKYRLGDSRIRDAVEKAVGDETNPYWMMRGIHRFIRDSLHYELAGGWNVAPRVLERGSGSCSEYTFLFISMCRAAGIPARYVGSLVVRGDDASTDDVFHRWSQVYLPNYGWIHVDPQGGDRQRPAAVAASIGDLSNRFLITTTGGGASEYIGWNYNYDQKWTAKGPVKIHSEAIAEWSPLAPAGSGANTASAATGDACTVE